MSKNTKTVLIVLAVAIGLCVVGGAAAIGGMGLLLNRVKDNITEDPEKAREMAQAIISYKLPEGYTETLGMDLLVYKFVAFGEDSETSHSKPIIVLAGFQADAANMTPEEMSTQVQKSMERQSGSKGLKMKLVETRQVTINGTETTLSVNEGTKDSTGETFRQWVTTFPGKNGLVLLLIQGTTDQWDDAVLNEFLASLGN